MARSPTRRAVAVSGPSHTRSAVAVLAVTALTATAFAVILNGLTLAVYQSTLTDETVALRDSLAVGISFGILTFIWALVLITMASKPRAALLLGAGAPIASLIATLAAGWYPPAPEVLAAYPILGAYKGAMVALYSVGIPLYAGLALLYTH